MHDHSSGFLRRTTNVKEKFPNIDFNYSANLTWKGLQSLNAGEWFLKVRLWFKCSHTCSLSFIYCHTELLCDFFHIMGSYWWQNHIWYELSPHLISRQILSIQCPSSLKRKEKQRGIRQYLPYFSSSTLPSRPISQWYLTYVVPTRKMTQWTQSVPSWSLASTQAW